MMLIDIVRPDLQVGRVSRELTMKDIIRVPVAYRRGEWNLGDMLSLESITALWQVQNAFEQRKADNIAQKRAAHKKAS